MSAAPSATALFQRLQDRLQVQFSADARAHAYLCDNGITDERLWSAFGIGAGEPSLKREFAADREALIESGLLRPKGPSHLDGGLFLPTYDLRQPEVPVGFIKLSYAQNKHAFATAPVGLAFTPDTLASKRIVITDTPLLGLRLVQTGVGGVVVAEQPDVLPPLQNWLRDRELLVASYKNAGLDAMHAALGELADKTAFHPVGGELLRTNPDTLAALGIDRDHVAPQEPTPPITPLILRDLMEYARQRLACGEGTAALETFGINAAFAETYRMGFLPVGFREALSRECRRSLSGAKIANTLLIPAFDADGAVVDLLAVHPAPCSRTHVNLLPEPVGLIAPKVASAFEDILIVDSLRGAAEAFAAGKRNVLLLRGSRDASNNAERLFQSGVRSATVRVRRQADEITAVLEAAGIVTTGAESSGLMAREIPRALKLQEQVEAEFLTTPATPMAIPAEEPLLASTLLPSITVSLAHHDTAKEQATFKAGDVEYRAEVNAEGDSRFEVRIERAGKIHLDRFDVAVEAQRRRFATSAAMKTGVAYEVIDGHLVSLLEQVRALQDQLLNPASTKPTIPIMTAGERTAAASALKQPGLLDTIASDLEAMGWVGEEKTKRLLYLTAISRKLHRPLSAALKASSGAGKSTGLERVAELVPPEDLIHVSRLTDSALYYQDRDALRHKLLLIDEADALTKEVNVALRVLQTRGALSQSHVVRDPVNGQTTTVFTEARGPVAVITSTAGILDDQTLSRCFELAVDDTPEQTARILTAQRRLRADASFQGSQGHHARIVQQHRNMQRLLESRSVLIPYADRIQFPASSIKHRREQERFLNLIEASALLHQHQRLKHRTEAGEEFVVAAVRDYEIAMDLASDSIGRASDELSSHARDVLDLVLASKLGEFDSTDVQRLKPEWARHKVRTGMNELVSLDVLVSSRRTRPRRYTLCVAAAEMLKTSAVRLLPAAAFGDLATSGEMGFTNTIQETATG